MYVIYAPAVLCEETVIFVVNVNMTVFQRFDIRHVARFSTVRIYEHKVIIFNEMDWAYDAYGRGEGSVWGLGGATRGKETTGET